MVHFDAMFTTDHTHTHTHTTVLQLCGFCPGQPGWADTRRNIHPLTPIVVINRPLFASSIYYDPQHPSCSIHAPDNLFPQSLSKLNCVNRESCDLRWKCGCWFTFVGTLCGDVCDSTAFLVQWDSCRKSL